MQEGRPRREFLKKAALLAGGAAAAGTGVGYILNDMQEGQKRTESAPSVRQSLGEENPDEEWLEEQFKKVETLDIEGHPLRIIDINPREAKSEVPVLIEGGYATYSPLHNKVNILEMARQKRRTLFIDEPRGIERKDKKQTPEEIEEFFLRQTEAILAALDKKDVREAAIVGHSEGCMSAAVAAYLYPDRIRNLVLFNPGGMIGDDSFVALCYRFLTEGLNELKRKKELMSPAAREQAKEGGEGFKKYLLEDKTASVNELRAMAKQQIRSLLKQAKRNGVGISIVHGVDDKVFPMKRMQKQAARTPAEKERGDDLIVDGFYSVKGGHGEFVMDPERWTQIADIALTALENKQRARATIDER